MPGLVAILMPRYDKAVTKNITEMADSISHETFYKRDVFNNSSVPFAGCRIHLNIINRQSQPVYNEDSTVFIMMDGELHNREEIGEKLKITRHNIKANSDAELLLHLYEEMGESFVNDLNGWFLAIIHDVKNRKTLIVNDCFGIYRAFYTHHNDTFVVSSEIKGLLKYDRLPYSLNREKYAEYFLYDAILDDETFFKEIHRLPPASIWTYKDGHVSKRQYFDFSQLEKTTSLSIAEFEDAVEDTFRRIMPRYLFGKNVNLSLTGGWDTRAILSVVNRLGYSLPCYVWQGPYRKSLDVRLAKKIAKTVGSQFQILGLGQDFFDNFSDYAYKTIYISDGSADVFKSHELYYNSLSRSISPIRLTGKYGTQTASRRFFRPKPKIDGRVFSTPYLSEIRDLKRYIRSFESRQSIMDVVRSAWPSGYLSIENSQLVVRTPYTDKDFVMLVFGAPDEYLQNRSVQKLIIKRNCSRLADIPSDKSGYIKSNDMLKNMKLWFISSIFKSLTVMDKAYLHFDVPNAATRLDPFMKVTGLEKLFLGFSYLDSYRRWVKNELKDFSKKILLDERTLSRPHFNPEFIKKMTSDHFENRANYVSEIGKVISFEIWYRLFVDREPIRKS
jgi:asparagine synthase (glutamine-hydrolysing)